MLALRTRAPLSAPPLSVPFPSIRRSRPLSPPSPSTIPRASSTDDQPRVGSVFPGKYGTWILEESDVKEVLAYRLSLAVAAFCALAVTPSHVLPDFIEPLDPLVEDGLVLTGAAAFGSATQLIHIYMSPIKKAIQALWAFGFLSACVIGAQAFEESQFGLLQHVELAPNSIWFLGPGMAAVTALYFKEGLCYDKPYPKIGCVLTPLLCLTHLANAVFPVPPALEQGLGIAWAVTAVVFAASKFDQPVTDDLGDKSIFDFLALPEEKQRERLRLLGGMAEDLE